MGLREHFENDEKLFRKALQIKTMDEVETFLKSKGIHATKEDLDAFADIRELDAQSLEKAAGGKCDCNCSQAPQEFNCTNPSHNVSGGTSSASDGLVHTPVTLPELSGTNPVATVGEAATSQTGTTPIVPAAIIKPATRK